MLKFLYMHHGKFQQTWVFIFEYLDYRSWMLELHKDSTVTSHRHASNQWGDFSLEFKGTCMQWKLTAH